MADIYVRSTDGNNADNGSTWALAKATLAGAAAIDAAGDRIYLSQAHAESTGSAVTIALAGTIANPVIVASVDDAAEPPTAVSTTATVTTTSGNIVLQGNAYFYGISFISAGSVQYNNTNAHAIQYYEQCRMETTNTGSGGRCQIGSTSNLSYKTTLRNCTFRMNATSQQLWIYGDVLIEGGSYVAGTVTPSPVFAFATDRSSGELIVSAFDFSNLASTVDFFSSAAANSGFGVLRNCKLPSGWTGGLVSSGTVRPGQRYEMYNCDSGDTNYKVWIQDFAGTLKDETVVVRTGGASDGTTPLSWKIVTNADCAYPSSTFESTEIARWNSTVGSSITATIEILTDNITLTDADIWIDVQYLGTSGFPLSLYELDWKANILTTAANQASSSEPWTTTGIGTPITQKLSVTFTPQEVGYLIATVKVARPSTTVYVDPKLVIT